MRNELDKETSPYLLQHADNPVHWQAWGPDALAAAKRDGKPILLSVGYAACHWCHVMAHESFEDDETARIMNSHFVNIKVDREERPDIDALYQNALALLGEHGGWPLTMFLTPDGAPFWGGTYFPPEPKYGRPGFKGLLQKVAEVYHSQGEAVAKNVDTMQSALGRLAQSESGELIPCALADRVAERLLGEFDPVHGGIGGAPKFPHCTILELVYRSWLRTGNEDMRDAVLKSLTRISQGGIYDHVGGGFARYATDAMWLVPHFEKMLYDNAQMIDILLLAWLDTGNPLFGARIRETATWVLREMVADGGSFAATLDADSEGEEGRFYVWTETEIDEVLGPDAPLFKSVYGVTASGNWEGKCILNRIDTPELRPADDEARLAEARAKLLAARERRVRPGWDDKVLADWNGLMIAALARAGIAMGEADWLTAARTAFDFVCARMTRPDDPVRLGHSMRAGKLNPNATLDDYAAMARAALVLDEATGEPVYLERAEDWVTVLDNHYGDETGGYYFTADDAEGLIVRTRSAADGATPAGNGIMAGVLARLWVLTGSETRRAQAERLVRAFSGELGRNVFPLATLINESALLERGVQVAIIGERDEPETAALVSAAFTAPQPDLVLRTRPPGAQLPDSHPAHGKDQVAGRPTAYVCVGPVCSLPYTDPQELRDAIARA